MNTLSHERSTDITHSSNPDQKQYDWLYYEALFPHITGNVLDIGSGALQFVKEYQKLTTSVTCLDKFTEDKILGINQINWVCPQHLPIAEKYDTIVSTEFIEHIDRNELEPLLEQITSIMAENGKFIGSTPNKIVPTTNPFHLYEYTKDELEEILKKYFSKVETKLVRQDCTVWIAQL